MDARLVIATTDSDVAKETQFRTLNTRGFVRGETPEYQWYLLVNEACAASGIDVDEIVRDYLATMLCRFMGRTELLEQLAAFDFFQHLIGAESVDSACTQDIADMSLQYVAFFPERSYNRHQPRSLEYVANMGTALFHELARDSSGKDDWFSRAFPLMEASFFPAVMVLRSACPRFAKYQEPLWKRFGNDTALLPNVREAAELGRALEQFKLMYLKPEDPQCPKTN